MGSLGGARKDVLQDKNGRGEGEGKKNGLGLKIKGVDGCKGGKKEGGKKGKEVFTVGDDEVDELDEDQENIGITTSRISSRASKSSVSSLGSSSSAEVELVVRKPKGRNHQTIPSSPPSSSSNAPSPIIKSRTTRSSASPAPSSASTTTRSSRSASARAVSDSPPPRRTTTSTRSKRAARVVPDTPPSSHASPLPSPAPTQQLHSDDDDDEEDNETTLKPLPPSTSSSLSSLLLACNQTTPSSFTSFLSNPLFFPSSSSANRIITKVGEATYSEVFSLSSGEGQRDLVMKVVPLMMRGDEEELEVAMEGLGLKDVKEVVVNEEEIDELDEEAEPTWSDPKDVAKEVKLGRLVGELEGFCDLIG